MNKERKLLIHEQANSMCSFGVFLFLFFAVVVLFLVVFFFAAIAKW